MNFFAEWRDPGEDIVTLGYDVLCVILINGLFSFWQEYRAEKALAASIFCCRITPPHCATAMRCNCWYQNWCRSRQGIMFLTTVG